MKYLLRVTRISLSLLLLAVLITSSPATAHVLKQNKNMSGVLHLPPQDAPVAGESTKLNVSFGDTENLFSLANCTCQVVLKTNNRVVQTAMLRPYSSGATLNSTTTVQFPDIGVYDIVVKGSARDGSFADFQLAYEVRVATSSGGSTGPSASESGGASIVLIGLASLAILGLFAHNNIRGGGRYSSLPKGKLNNTRRL